MIDETLAIIFHPVVGLILLIAGVMLWQLFKIELDYVLMTIIYFWALVINNWTRKFVRWNWLAARSVVSLRHYRFREYTVPTLPESVLEYNSRYQLKDLEVILGFGERMQEIRVNLRKSNTLIAGITGAGKTIMIHGILIQLFQRGARFRDNYQVYLFDLKGYKEDYLYMWASLVDGYYSISPDDLGESTVVALEELARRMQSDRSGRTYLIIIDELAQFTSQAPDTALKKRATRALLTIVSQVRTVGTCVAMTQRPQYESIPRNVSGQFDRKVAMRVEDNQDGWDIILRAPKTLPYNFMGFRQGEFILKDPDKRQIYVQGRTIPVVLPDEIDMVLAEVAGGRIYNDMRVKLLGEATAGVVQGSAVVGINKIAGTDFPMSNKRIEVAYRNFLQAGIFVVGEYRKGGGVAYYNLAVPKEKAYDVLVRYIQEGRWEDAPEPKQRGEVSHRRKPRKRVIEGQVALDSGKLGS